MYKEVPGIISARTYIDKRKALELSSNHSPCPFKSLLIFGLTGTFNYTLTACLGLNVFFLTGISIVDATKVALKIIMVVVRTLIIFITIT